MNIRIFGGISVVAVVAFLVLNVSISTKNNQLSDVFLSNVQALARNEGGGTMTCPSSSQLCDFRCSKCGTLLGSIDGRTGIPSNISGSCPKCGHTF